MVNRFCAARPELLKAREKERIVKLDLFLLIYSRGLKLKLF